MAALNLGRKRGYKRLGYGAREMNGIHDMGGMHGFGPVVVEVDEPVFHAAWEKRVLGIAYQVIGFGWATLDSFRHGIERIDPVTYLTTGYYGRWLASLDRVLVEAGVLTAGEVEARAAGRPTGPAPAMPPHPTRASAGYVRDVQHAPRFAVGQAVRARIASPAGHTRLPRYVAGRCGQVQRWRGAFVFPDTNAHGQGEDPQHLYSVRFDATELWGADAEAGATLCIDLFEPYLESA
jgi:nitrile hydratase beta subunit